MIGCALLALTMLLGIGVLGNPEAVAAPSTIDCVTSYGQDQNRDYNLVQWFDRLEVGGDAREIFGAPAGIQPNLTNPIGYSDPGGVSFIDSNQSRVNQGSDFHYWVSIDGDTPIPCSGDNIVLPGQETPTCNGLAATIVGTDDGETIYGTSGDDVIVALGGNDTVYGGNGEDVICLGEGDDNAEGGRHDDVIFGEGGSDEIRGNWGRDTIDGGTGHDEGRGGAGRDTCINVEVERSCR